jgi:ribonuclease-3
MLDGYTMDVLEQRIGYCFHNKALLKQALTHSSYTNEQKINKTENYERIEFLGDAVLELVSSDFLFREHPDVPEGELTKMRASMVCEPSLAFCARDLELGQFMLLGKGEENTGGRRRDSITSDGMEAMIGAIYLDGGMQPAKAFIDRFILSDLEDGELHILHILVVPLQTGGNLQELIQGKLKKEFEYRLLEESGPEHDKTFVVEIDMEGECLGRGQGRTKKAAEQQAAYEALLLLRDRGYVFKKY